MIKCAVCGFRHRSIEKHTQRFGKRWTVIDGKKVDTDEELIAGQTPETRFDTTVEADNQRKQIRIIVGAAPFAKKRRKPPLNWRQNRFVELVRNSLPNEYTVEELQKARAKARRVLARAYGRHGFLPPIWQDTKKEEHVKSKTEEKV